LPPCIATHSQWGGSGVGDTRASRSGGEQPNRHKLRRSRSPLLLSGSCARRAHVERKKKKNIDGSLTSLYISISLQQTMMPEQVRGPIRPLGVVPLSIRIGRQLSPGQTLFLLRLLSFSSFLLSCFHLMYTNNKTLISHPGGGILCISPHFFHLFMAHRAK